MPTGYTADVGSGKVTDFRTFALRCARNFGACIMQRDDPASDAPKLTDPSDHCARARATAAAELERFQGMSIEQAGREADAEWAAHIQREMECRQQKRETEDRYRAMLRRVEAWTPPTPEHDEMKRFMVSQLKSSIGFDCATYPDREKHLSGEEWLNARREKAAHDIGYYTAEDARERKLTAERNAWITALYRSLEEE